MIEDPLPALVQKQRIETPEQVELLLNPFILQPKNVGNSFELSQIVGTIFDQEAARLGLNPETYEYSNLNTMYQCEHPALQTHYLILVPGSPLMRGLLGNRVGPDLKKKYGIDISGGLELGSFDFEQVLFLFPGVNVGGYGVLHSFLNRLNTQLREYNLMVAYLRQEEITSFRHGFYDHIGLIWATPVPNKKRIVLGEVDLESVDEIEGRKLYDLEVRGGRVLMAPLASCNWNLVDLGDVANEELAAMNPSELPLGDRAVDTFHFLNGATPHYFKQRLEQCFDTMIHQI